MTNPFAALFGVSRAASISSSHDLMLYLAKGWESLSGQTVSETSALSVSAVMTCVSLRSRALASLPVRVYERIDERSKRPAVNHPVSRVLAKPNTWQTRAELFGMLEAHRTLRGNAYCWKNLVPIASGDGIERLQVAELIPLHPDRVEVEQPDEGGPLFYKLHRRRGPVVELPQVEVLHLRGLTTDGVKGRTVLQDAREMIGGALATQEHANVLWKNGGTPSIVLRHPKTLSEKAKDGLEKRWAEVYGGTKDKRRVAVIEEGMEIEQLSLSAQDAQFLETRKFQRGEIAGWFHVPPFMIGDTEKSTSWGTGIEQQQIGFLTFTLRPDLVAWEQRLVLDLIHRPDRFFLEFNIDGFQRGDAASQAAYFWRMIQAGVLSPNDVRGFLNLNPIEGGDIYLQPTNMAPLGSDPLAAPGNRGES